MPPMSKSLLALGDDGTAMAAYALPQSAFVIAPANTKPICFLCGCGVEAGALEGSGHAGDCVHLDCLATQPFDWDGEAA